VPPSLFYARSRLVVIVHVNTTITLLVELNANASYRHGDADYFFRVELRRLLRAEYPWRKSRRRT
jgi:hypothetical protein